MSSELSIAEAKRVLRERIKVLRKSLAAPDPSSVVEGILSLPQWKSASTVLLYHALPGEVDLTVLMDVPGKRVALPLVEGDSLLLKEYLPGTLVRGYAGIMEPPFSAPDVELSEIGLAIIPGVAFDPEGHRLGRGRGFYDRLLPGLRCPLVGAAYSWQMVEKVPTDPWDVSLDLVVTDTRTYSVR